MKNEVIPTTGRDSQPICTTDEKNARMKKGGIKRFAKTRMQNIINSPIKLQNVKNILPVLAVKPIIWLHSRIYDYIFDLKRLEIRSLWFQRPQQIYPRFAQSLSVLTFLAPL